MNDMLEKICHNCNYFFPDTLDTFTENGICLDDEVFDPYIDDILEGKFYVCSELIKKKKFPGNTDCCSKYEEVENIGEDEPDFEQLFDLIIEKKLQKEMQTEAKVKEPEYSFEDHSFTELLIKSKTLKEVRLYYSEKSAKERRMAADSEYHAAPAIQIFHDLIGEQSAPLSIPGEVVALAIDPEYAPAILTVGSFEYIRGRVPEAIELLQSLTRLPKDTEDLPVIIEKAGVFLLEAKEFQHALCLYSSAVEKFPEEKMFLQGLENCHIGSTKTIHGERHGLEKENE